MKHPLSSVHAENHAKNNTRYVVFPKILDIEAPSIRNHFISSDDKCYLYCVAVVARVEQGQRPTLPQRGKVLYLRYRVVRSKNKETLRIKAGPSAIHLWYMVTNSKNKGIVWVRAGLSAMMTEGPHQKASTRYVTLQKTSGCCITHLAQMEIQPSTHRPHS